MDGMSNLILVGLHFTRHISHKQALKLGEAGEKEAIIISHSDMRSEMLAAGNYKEITFKLRRGEGAEFHRSSINKLSPFSRVCKS